jgi:AcrR family transcriptional regulator
MSAATAEKQDKPGARQQLIAAAERLFAESGIDAVSLRQINVAAGQKNSSAAHYHFGSKEALILSIYQVRMARVNARRLETLDRIQAENRQSDVRALIEAIVMPIVAEIDADESGQHYIRFMAQAIGHPQLDLMELSRQEHASGLSLALEMLRKAVPHVPSPLFGQRFGLAFEQIVHSLADREKLRHSRGDTFEIDAGLFVSNLIDTISGGMSAPVSEQTRQNLGQLRT